MKGGTYVAIAFEALALNRVRSALTMLGVIIGVFAVVAMYGLGQASQAYVTSQIQGLGARVLIVSPGNPKAQGRGGPPGIGIAARLTLADAEAMRTVPGVALVSPSAFSTLVLEAGKQTVAGTVLGTNELVVEVRGLKVAEGRFFSEQEARGGTRVVVLGRNLAAELFKASLAAPVGGKVRIGSQRFRVVGVLALQGGGLFGSVDDQAFVPVRAYQAAVDPRDSINSIFVAIASADLLPMAEARVADLLRRRHGIRQDEEDDFKVQTQAEVLKTVSMVTGAFTVLVAGIAAISLLVGGIGIMNIMLVSVTERTREIGVRRAMGAKTSAILIQFLIEAAALSLAGGTVGIVLGVATTYAVSRLTPLPFVFSPLAIASAFLFSALVGVAFGVYPASKAARLDPVDALRYE